MRYLALLSIVSGFWGAFFLQSSFAQTAPAALPDVDLKLFEKSEVDLTKGCTVTLWQPDRDREKDKYAYLFVEQLYGKNHTRQGARIKIAGQIISMTRIATGGKSNGYGLYDYQLYKLPNDGDFAILDLKQGELEGEAISIDGGTMSIIMRGRNVFRASVKGGAGCYGAPISVPPATAPAKKVEAPAPSPAPTPAPTKKVEAPVSSAPAKNVEDDISSGGFFERYTVHPSQVPRAFSQAVQKKFDCEPDFMKTGIIGFQMSEESAIWQVPCERFAFQTNAVYALVYLPDPAKEHKFLSFQEPKGKKGTGVNYTLVSPEWDVKNRVVKAVAFGRVDGDCGIFEKHRVSEDGKFVLIEYREKKNCDGKETKPENYPLVFKAR